MMYKAALIRFGFVLSLLTCALYAHAAYAPYAWTETQSAGNLNHTWRMSTSDDGSIALAGATTGRLYISTDHGFTWGETQPAGDVDRAWVASASNADGSKLLAVSGSIFNGRLYLSTDRGATWHETRPAGDVNKEWIAGAMSDDGNVMLAAATNDRIYRSLDGGTTWSETRPAGNVSFPWFSVAVSADGSTLVASGVGTSVGRIFRSTDSGATWSEIQPMVAMWPKVAMSADGQKLLAGVGSGGRLYLSTNGGTSWSETRPAGDVDQQWTSAAMSSDGDILFAASGSATGHIYVSTDGGASWVQTGPTADPDQYWVSVATPADGSYALAGVMLGGLFTATQDITPPTLVSLSPADNATDVQLNPLLQMTFNEPIATSTGTITLRRLPSNQVVESFSMSTLHVSVSGNTLIISFSPLKKKTDYYVELSAGAVTDLAGNPFPGLTGSTAWNFSTIAH